VNETEETRAAKAVKELEACSRNADTEHAHVVADGVLCKFLEDLGWPEVVEAYRRVPRWYA
jgi:hypothetical protein